jgi:hypothetical protein
VYIMLPRLVKALADVDVYLRRAAPGAKALTVVSVFADYRTDLVGIVDDQPADPDKFLDCSHMLNFCK